MVVSDEIKYNIKRLSQDKIKEYHNDPRWIKATQLTKTCRFGDCNKLVLEIQVDHGCFGTKSKHNHDELF